MAMHAKRFQVSGSGIVMLFFAMSFFGTILRAQPKQTEQDSGTPSPSFEVASIKQTPAGTSGGGYNLEPGGRTVVRNFTLKNLIMLAWHVQVFQVQGTTGWMDTTRYDIEAKGPDNSSDDQSRLMLQSLLADRFHLTLHRETKDLSIFALRRTASSGTSLTPAKEGSCTPPASQSATAPPVVSPPLPPCGATFRLIKSQDNGSTTMSVEGRGVTIDLLARTFGTVLGRHVTNVTGLSGSFDLRLEYKPEDFSAPPMAVAQSTDSTAPSFFTALEDQLGLKLESQKGPVEVLVVDHAERPSEN